MPEISRFYGVNIYMYFSQSQTPHFHVWYNDYKAIINIYDGTVKGELPKTPLLMVYEWLNIHKDELLKNWQKIANNQAPDRISPLEKTLVNDILTVEKATYFVDYQIIVTFNNGITKILDFSNIISSGKGIYSKLADTEFFKDFTLDHFTIVWNNEIAFDPEFLFKM